MLSWFCFVCMKVWLCDVEKAMRKSLNIHLSDFISCPKKTEEQRKKCVTECPGQVHFLLLTVSGVPAELISCHWVVVVISCFKQLFFLTSDL